MADLTPSSSPDSSPASERPVIGLTMGDPAGIGPEVLVKALADPELRRAARYVIYGVGDVLTYTADSLGMDPGWFRVRAESPRSRRTITEDVLVLDHEAFSDGLEPMLMLEPGPSRLGGLASKTFVEEAIRDAMTPAKDPRHIDAIVTAPISKTSWELAGYRWPGHTEVLAHRTRAKRTTMMFASDKLNVALATAHIPLSKLRDALTIGAVFDPIDLGAEACRQLGIASPRIAVAGLNPHAGEGGIFGDEENRIIAPAIEMARNNGVDVRGPFPADTVFIDAVAGRYDLVVAMYHDQGLIPVKLLARDEAVNWTLGLPIVRTSPDHGTAFDIAGRGRANAGSMAAAIRLALRLSRPQPAPAN